MLFADQLAEILIKDGETVKAVLQLFNRVIRISGTHLKNNGVPFRAERFNLFILK